MGELVNTFSWSFSAASDFEECRRKRYWSKYAMWGGWNRDASPTQRAAYRLNKMENRYSLQGHAVEEAIVWMLKHKQRGKQVSAEQAYQEIARPYLNRAWQESKKGQWREHPKKYCCLHEHYYPQFLKVSSDEWTSEIAHNVKQCLHNFHEHVLPRLQDVRPEHEVVIATPEFGDPESFEFEGIKVYAIPDYVYRQGEAWHIHDWKSGQASKRHEDQLGLYALWAFAKHGVPIQKVRLYLEYLQVGQVVSRTLTASDLEHIQEKVRLSVADMAEYVVDGDIPRNKPLAREDWELAPTRTPCRHCNFFELCEPEFE